MAIKVAIKSNYHDVYFETTDKARYAEDTTHEFPGVIAALRFIANVHGGWRYDPTGSGQFRRVNRRSCTALIWEGHSEPERYCLSNLPDFIAKYRGA